MAVSSSPPSTAPAPTSAPTTIANASAAPAGSPRPSSSSTGVQELSRLLLEGWTMLADTCPRPGCTMPLARSRTGRVVCCSCGLDVVHPSNRPAATSEATASRATPRDPPSANPAAPDAADASRAMVPAVSTTPTPRAQRDAVSARLGEKLLQGWTLLDADCVRCALPLLRDGAGRVVCVGCHDAGAAHASPLPPSQSPSQPERDARQLMPRVMRVPANGAVGRLAPRSDPAPPPPRAEPAALPPGVPLRALGAPVGGQVQDADGEVHADADVDVDVDVDAELRLVEAEAARKLRALRRALARADDAERCRVVAAAAAAVALVVTRAREARAVGARLGGGEGGGGSGGRQLA